MERAKGRRGGGRRRAPGPRGPSTGTGHARGRFPPCSGKAKRGAGGSGWGGGGGGADPPRICPAALLAIRGWPTPGRTTGGAGAAGGGRCGSGGPIEPLDPRRGLLAGRHARRLAVARRHPAPARRIAAQIANAAGRRIAGGMPAARNVRITLPASARSRPGRAASRRSQGTAAAGSVNRRACGRRSKPAIASGCDPIPFRTWKSNLASLSCY